MSGDDSESLVAKQRHVSRKQSAAIVAAGLVAVSLFFCAGGFVGLHLSGSASDLSSIIARLASPWEEGPSPTVVPEEESATATSTRTARPSPTTGAETPTPGGALVAIPTIPSGHPSAVPEESVGADEWEPDGTPEDARPIEIGGVQAHNLHAPGDVDWLYFEAEADGSYVIETSGLGREIDTVISLYNGSGAELASDDDGGAEVGSSRILWVAQESGRLYVRVQGLAGTEEGPRTQYDVSVRLWESFRMDEYEPDDSATQATRIEMGETQRHNRHVSGDEDWIYFLAEAGVTYVVETSRLGERADTVVYLYDAQGNELALDDDGAEEERASRLRWTAPDSGLFFVKVGNWLPTSSGPGTGYDLTLRPPRGG